MRFAPEDTDRNTQFNSAARPKSGDGDILDEGPEPDSELITLKPVDGNTVQGALARGVKNVAKAAAEGLEEREAEDDSAEDFEDLRNVASTHRLRICLR